MKNFILVLMVVSTIISCGKDNKVGSAAGAPGVTSPITTGVTGAADLGSKIDSYTTSFGVGQVMLYGTPYTYNQIISTTPTLVKYKYGRVNYDCKWDVKDTCLFGKYTTPTTTRTVTHSEVDVVTKQNELKAIINSVSTYNPNAIQTNGVVYYITTTSGIIYAIDVRLPLQANPIGIQQANGQTEYLLGTSI